MFGWWIGGIGDEIAPLTIRADRLLIGIQRRGRARGGIRETLRGRNV